MIKPIVLSLRILGIIFRMFGAMILAPLIAIKLILDIVIEEILAPFIRWMELAINNFQLNSTGETNMHTHTHMKTVLALLLLLAMLLLATPATLFAQTQTFHPPAPGVEDIYVHITRVGFLDYRDGNFWNIHFEVINGPARPYPHLFQKVLVYASQPGQTTLLYTVQFDADLTKRFRLVIVGPVPKR